jgi:TPP-dependent pyruvate/acetoin dehydrogenase alpha subunit
MTGNLGPGEHSAWQMLRIREFENRIQSLFSEGLVKGTTHLANGQEAVAVGMAAAMHAGDPVLCTYRGHHHSIARGLSLEAAFAEILGRETGCCGGKGGSMHLTDKSLALMGSYAIIGSHIPIAVGAAWASALTRDGSVTCCMFGDGTTTIGSFHEALNLAAVWKLPVVFICENNLYSEYTRIEDVVPIAQPAADRAGAYGLERIVIDGNDVDAVEAAVAAARAQAARGGGPSLIEALTYRQGGHSRADPAKYRPQEEVDYWMSRDPITVSAERHGIRPERLEELTRAAREEVEFAVQAALAAPEPAPEALLRHVWSESTS